MRTAHTPGASASKPEVGEQLFDTWGQAITHATRLEQHGEISRHELNDVKTAARAAGKHPVGSEVFDDWKEALAHAQSLYADKHISRDEFEAIKDHARKDSR